MIISNKYHDRFIIIDDTFYHCGASLKDLGKKCFAINKIKDVSSMERLIEGEYKWQSKENYYTWYNIYELGEL